MTILAAEYTTGSKARSAQVAINLIRDGRRQSLHVQAVSGKREARAIAVEFGAHPWNF